MSEARQQRQQRRRQRQRPVSIPLPVLLAAAAALLAGACRAVSAFFLCPPPDRPSSTRRDRLATVRASAATITPSSTTATPCGGCADGHHDCGCGGCGGGDESQAWMPSLTPSALAAVLAVAGGEAAGGSAALPTHRRPPHHYGRHQGPVHVVTVVKGSGARAPKLEATWVEIMEHMHRRMQFVDPGASCLRPLHRWPAESASQSVDRRQHMYKKERRVERSLSLFSYMPLLTQPRHHHRQPTKTIHPDFCLHVVTVEEILAEGGPAAFGAKLPPGVSRPDIVYFLGIEHPEVAARVAPCLHGVADVVALDSCSALRRQTRIGPARPQGRFAVLWRALPLPTRRKKLLTIFDTLKSFWDRGHSDDLLYMVLVVINARVKNIPSVSEILKPVTLQALRCMVRGCVGWMDGWVEPVNGCLFRVR